MPWSSRQTGGGQTGPLRRRPLLRVTELLLYRCHAKRLREEIGAPVALRRIRNRKAVDASKGRELMHRAWPRADDVLDAKTANRQRIGNKRAMTAPRHRFSAHERAAVGFRKLDRLREVV